MKKYFLAVTMLLSGYTIFAQDTDKLLPAYLSVKDALIATDSKASAKATGDFVDAVKTGKDFAQKNDLLKAAEAMNKSTDIEKQRTAFEKVSTIMWDVVKQSGALSQDVYYQYCPMKKAYWLSNEAAIKNPYYGAKMLACGSVKDKKLK
ncbi:MAG: DUF3347 domain-containing protein [Agriterribacter sp.]